MAEEIYVDASAPFVWSDDHPLTFFKGTRENTWLYASRAGRIAVDGNGRYRLAIARNRKRERNAGGGIELVTKGGVLAAQINVAPLVGTVEDEKAWSDAIKRQSPFVPPGVDRLVLRPLGLRDGTMTISGLEGLVADPAAYRSVPIGLQTAVPITVELTPDGADRVWGMLGGAALPINVRFDYLMDVLYPSAHYRITANTLQIYDFFSVNAKARASYYGLVGAEAEAEVVRSELLGSGAVKIEWLAKPAGFDDARVAELQKSILDAFAKSALDLMVAEVVTDTEAPDPSGFFGGVSVKLKDVEQVRHLELSGEYQQSDLRTQTFSFSFSFLQLGPIDPAVYGSDVTGDNMVPITVNLGRESRYTRRYLCQYGYRRPDGTVVSDSAEAAAEDGLMIRGVAQWGQHDAAPETSDIQFAVDWIDGDWEDYATVVQRDIRASGVLFEFTPGNYVKDLMVHCDFARAEPGTFGMFEWRTVLPPNPDGTRPKNYSGGFFLEGTGPGSALMPLPITFPYHHETIAGARFEWEATLVKPDGTLLSRKGDESLEGLSVVPALRALLRPVQPAAMNPRLASALRLVAGRTPA